MTIECKGCLKKCPSHPSSLCSSCQELINWQDETNVSNCQICKSEFGFFNRVHHCRSCGKCSQKMNGASPLYEDNQRMCKVCLNQGKINEFEHDRLYEFMEERATLLADYYKDVIDIRNRFSDQQDTKRLLNRSFLKNFPYNINECEYRGPTVLKEMTKTLIRETSHKSCLSIPHVSSSISRISSVERVMIEPDQAYYFQPDLIDYGMIQGSRRTESFRSRIQSKSYRNRTDEQKRQHAAEARQNKAIDIRTRRRQLPSWPKNEIHQFDSQFRSSFWSSDSPFIKWKQFIEKLVPGTTTSKAFLSNLEPTTIEDFPLPIWRDSFGFYWAFGFHGTRNPNGVENAGLRHEYSDEGMLGGKRVYFAVQACKAIQYAEGNNRAVFISAINLGYRPHIVSLAGVHRRAETSQGIILVPTAQQRQAGSGQNVHWEIAVQSRPITFLKISFS